MACRSRPTPRGDYWALLLVGPAALRARRRAAEGRRGGGRARWPTGALAWRNASASTRTGGSTCRWTWDPAAAEPDDRFATELSLAGPVRLAPLPTPRSGASTSRRSPSPSAASTAPAKAKSRCGWPVAPRHSGAWTLYAASLRTRQPGPFLPRRTPAWSSAAFTACPYPAVHGRPSRPDLPLAPALHVRVDGIDLVHLQPERAPRGHALLRPPRAHDVCTKASLVLIGPSGLSETMQVRRDRRAEHILAVTAGAVQVVLLPAVVDRLRHGVPGRLVVRVAERRVGRSAAACRLIAGRSTAYPALRPSAGGLGGVSVRRRCRRLRRGAAVVLRGGVGGLAGGAGWPRRDRLRGAGVPSGRRGSGRAVSWRRCRRGVPPRRCRLAPAAAAASVPAATTDVRAFGAVVHRMRRRAERAERRPCRPSAAGYRIASSCCSRPWTFLSFGTRSVCTWISAYFTDP